MMLDPDQGAAGSVELTPTETILRDLVAFDTTSRYSNLDLLDYVEAVLQRHGVASRRVPDASGTKANLWATIGPEVDGGLVLSGHTDCVPVEGQVWASDPFLLTERDGLLFGRGACDMKGFLASCLAAVPDLIERSLPRPVHLAFSCDEEVGCIGVRSLIADLATRGLQPGACLVGEPTSMQVITGNKGGRSYRCRLRGHAVHSSLAPQGVNAISAAADLVRHLDEVGRELAAGPQDTDYDVPHTTLSVGLIHGGTAINIVPATCEMTFEFRTLAGVDQDAIVGRVTTFVQDVILPSMQQRHPDAGFEIEAIYEYPAHALSADHELVTRLKRLVGRNDHAKVAFGTEAGLFQRDLGVPTIICGPGAISVAHQPDEHVSRAELAACDRLIRELAQDWADQ